MPRYRKLHVKTVESLDINDMPDDFTRLLWVLLPLALCSQGRGLNNPAWLKSKLFPLRQDINQDTITEAVSWFVQRGMVVPYSVKGRDYFYVPTFHKYQGNTTREAASDYPPPEPVAGEIDSTHDKVTTDSRQSREEVKAMSSRMRTASASEYCILPIESESEQESTAIGVFLSARGGGINPVEVDLFNDIVDEYEKHRQALPRAAPGADIPGDDWVKAAVLEANASRDGTRSISLNYVKAILDRWRVQGFKAKFNQPEQSTTADGRMVIKVGA